MRTVTKVLKTVIAAVAVLLAIVVVREAFVSPISYFVIVPGAKVFMDDGWSAARSPLVAIGDVNPRA